jgi:pantothenate kinase type III
MKLNIAVFFGGESVEHEVSVISAHQAMNAMSSEKYNIIPVYVAKDRKLYCSDLLRDMKSYKDIPALLKKCTQVTLVQEDNKVAICPVHTGLFGRKELNTIDVAIPVMHGTNGEDGTIQGFLEMLKVPYAGCDLIAAAVAAHYIYGSPSLIIDMGTATKMTVVDHKGAFIGTSIIPGVMMGLNSLSEGTAQLPKISLEKPSSVIAKNTADCMRSGVLYGNASLIDGMIDRISQEFGSELPVYATGGMASLIMPLCRHEIPVDEHLVLKGLNILYQKNKP